MRAFVTGLLYVLDMHRILLRTLHFDLPGAVHDAGLDFWGQALLARPQRGINYPEYHGLEHAAALPTMYVQNVNADGPRIHFDIESDDQPAEVARLVGLGAQVLAEHPSDTVGDWTVLRDPVGIVFCVVRAEPDADFEAKAVRVG